MNLHPRIIGLQDKLRSPQVAPGSAEERAILDQARSIQAADTKIFAHVHGNALNDVATKHGVVYTDAAHHAGEAALEHVTGEHAAIVIPPENPQQLL